MKTARYLVQRALNGHGVYPYVRGSKMEEDELVKACKKYAKQRVEKLQQEINKLKAIIVHQSKSI